MAKAPIKREKEFILCKGHNSPFLNCIGNKGSSEYYNSWSPFSDGKVSYCKQCCEKMIQYYLKENGSMKSALWYTLMKLDIPFIKEVYEKLNDKANNGDKNGRKIPITLGSYIIELQKSTTKKEIWNDFSSTNVDISDINTISKSKEALKSELEDLQLIWGKEKSIEQLQYLEYRYNSYIDDKDLNEYQDSLYHDLCVAELDIYENRDIDKAIKRKTEIAKILGLDNFHIDKEKSLVEKLLETRIYEMEHTEPSDFYKDKEKYCDFMGIDKYWKNHVIRPIRNLLLGEKEYKIEKEEE